MSFMPSRIHREHLKAQRVVSLLCRSCSVAGQRLSPLSVSLGQSLKPWTSAFLLLNKTVWSQKHASPQHRNPAWKCGRREAWCGESSAFRPAPSWGLSSSGLQVDPSPEDVGKPAFCLALRSRCVSRVVHVNVFEDTC